MRRLALLSLIAYLSIVFSPFAMAIEYTGSSTEMDGIKICSVSFYETTADSLQTEVNDFKNKTQADDAKCGEENGITKFIEKGDCTDEGKVITEISEVFGEDTETGEGDTENKIVTVYKGSCCFVIGNDSNNNPYCKEVVEVYKSTYEDCTATATGCQKRQWVIGTSGAGIIKVYVKQIYRWAAMTVGTVAVVTMVISGIQISLSGVSGDISSAKTKMMSALAGLVLLFLSGLILYTINPTFFS